MYIYMYISNFKENFDDNSIVWMIVDDCTYAVVKRWKITTSRSILRHEIIVIGTNTNILLFDRNGGLLNFWRKTKAVPYFV